MFLIAPNAWKNCELNLMVSLSLKYSPSQGTLNVTFSIKTTTHTATVGDKG